MKDTSPKKGLFILENGQNLAFTFILISSLFLLWGLCNGMIDAMDKHFQDELGLSKSQSAWVQFAHYLGYFLMALPAGWLASRLGYKGGIIAGLLMVAAGGFWFVPATKINDWAQRQKITVAATPDPGEAQADTAPPPVKSSSPIRPETIAFIGYLLGVCAIAAGLTFLETVANPYTTVLGPREYAATRINLAQSCNGIGWILGPIIGGLFFYAKDASGHSIGSEMLYIPYVTVACVVLVLSVIFFFAYIPDVKTKDDYGDKPTEEKGEVVSDRRLNRLQIFTFLWLNVAVLICITGIFSWLLFSMFDPIGKSLQGIAATLMPFNVQVTQYNSLLVFIAEIACVLIVFSAFWLIFVSRKVSHNNIWSHPHFSGSVLAQFLYVAAQAGIFSFFINYMTSEVPALPKFLTTADSKAKITEKIQKGEVGGFLGYFQKKSKDWFETDTMFRVEDIKDFPAFVQKIQKAQDPVSAYIKADFQENFPKTSALRELEEYQGGDARGLRSVLLQELNLLVRQDPRKAKGGVAFYNPKNFEGITLSEEAQNLRDQKLAEDVKIAADLERIKAEEAQMSKEEKIAAAKERMKTAALTERVNAPLLNRLLLQEAFPDELVYRRDVLAISEQGAAFLLSAAFFCFLLGRFTGAGMLRKVSAHKLLGLYGIVNIFMCLLIFAKWGWLSVACVFLSFFFMSIMFPTIFALGIHGLGERAKKASAFLVMAIMGGAVLPKLMGYVADQYDMSRGFIVPLGCFAFIAIYGFFWPKFSGFKSLSGAKTS
ncbi:MAG: MFS transporter [Planctomycetaceae bacterium]|nr:MFS transporter [Planctomycetaceae bacterium]